MRHLSNDFLSLRTKSRDYGRSRGHPRNKLSTKFVIEFRVFGNLLGV